MPLILSLGAVLVGLAGVYAPLAVAFLPRLGLGPLVHLRALRLSSVVLSTALAIAGLLIAPSGWSRVALGFTGLTTLLVLIIKPTAIFVTVDCPRHVPGDAADLAGEAVVIGAQVAGQAAAWPLEMLVPHHLVNDHLGGQPLLVAY